MTGSKLRILLPLLPIGLAMIAVFSWFTHSSYSVAFELQKYNKCLPHSWWVLDHEVDKTAFKKGSLVQVSSSHFPEQFPADPPEQAFPLLKMVMAVTGDVVRIDNKQVFINDKYVGERFHHAKYPAPFETYTLQSGELWLSGTSDTTVDSRYFGVVDDQLIEAHAYAVF